MDRKECIELMMRMGKISENEIEEYVEYLEDKLCTVEKKEDGMRWVKLGRKNIEISRDTVDGKEFYRLLVRV